MIGKLVARLPKRNEFDAGFKKLKYSDEYPKDKRVIQYVLRKIFEMENSSVTIDAQLMTIEHIEPQSSKSIGSQSVAEIGNLWLLSAEQNNKLGNAPVVKKIPAYKAMRMVADPVLDGATVWGSAEISKRTEYFRDKMWSLVLSI